MCLCVFVCLCVYSNIATLKFRGKSEALVYFHHSYGFFRRLGIRMKSTTPNRIILYPDAPPFGTATTYRGHNIVPLSELMGPTSKAPDIASRRSSSASVNRLGLSAQASDDYRGKSISDSYHLRTTATSSHSCLDATNSITLRDASKVTVTNAESNTNANVNGIGISSSLATNTSTAHGTRPSRPAPVPSKPRRQQQLEVEDDVEC